MARKSVVSCSFSKILLVVCLVASLVLIIRQLMLHETVYASVVDGRRLKNFNLPTAKLAAAATGKEEDETNTYIEVERMQPRVSFSMKATLDKLVAEGNNLPGPLPPNKLSPGIPFRGGAGLSHLKASLKDPSFVQKIRNLENRRQDLYVTILDRNGQIVTSSEDGSKTIISFPEAPVKFPNNLKRSLDDWSDRERIWLNITHFPWVKLGVDSPSPILSTAFQNGVPVRHDKDEEKDDPCRRYAVKFGRDLSIVGLASYPSSGNTWMRYLIEGSTGYYTGSMYNDISLRKKGMYGEGVPENSRMVMTVKTHGYTTDKGLHVSREEQIKYNHYKEVNNSAILLIRNPYAALIGHRHLDQGGHTGLAKQQDFVGDSWDEYVKERVANWVNFYIDWLENTEPKNILVVHYENIKISLRHTLRRVLAFLQLEEDTGRLGCVLDNPTGLFKREHNKTPLTGDPFTPSQKTIINNAIDQLNRQLKRFGKESLPTHLYQYYTPSDQL